VRIRRSTGSGASPLPGPNENRNEQTRTRSQRRGAFVPGASVCEPSAGAPPLIAVVSITVVAFGGGR
jgi:hypothetical protein